MDRVLYSRSGHASRRALYPAKFTAQAAEGQAVGSRMAGLAGVCGCSPAVFSSKAGIETGVSPRFPLFGAPKSFVSDGQNGFFPPNPFGLMGLKQKRGRGGVHKGGGGCMVGFECQVRSAGIRTGLALAAMIQLCAFEGKYTANLAGIIQEWIPRVSLQVQAAATPSGWGSGSIRPGRRNSSEIASVLNGRENK